MEKSYNFNLNQLESSLLTFEEKGITEFTLHDKAILCNKEKLLSFLKLFLKNAPSTFLNLCLEPSMLDADVCKILAELFCSLDVVLKGESKGNSYLFDKKFFSRRAQMLNTLGLVFGFEMDFAISKGDGIKLFFDRLDFATGLYPNHINFLQVESFLEQNKIDVAKPSATFSTQDIKRAFDVCIACSVFYTYGRAIPWFLAVLKPLKISPSKFFEDFAQWLKINNFKDKKDLILLRENHRECEKLQLDFLKFKYEEKKLLQYFELVSNIVRLNGAFARCAGENEESEVSMSYNPDEILTAAATGIKSFFENSFMEYSKVRVFLGDDGPEMRYC
ncbi:hypothetical protein HRO26_02970 [Treponema pectinovorum]|uniref:hypothetical protein n=1 Tax=Treponema pectinovorum TaxID=164 RepID=UPI003D90B42D